MFDRTALGMESFILMPFPSTDRPHALKEIIVAEGPEIIGEFQRGPHLTKGLSRRRGLDFFFNAIGDRRR